MPCNTDNTDCAPCQDCPPSIPPVLPRCQDIVLVDGVYPNATIVVSQGCIIQVEAGEAMAYQPDICCPTGGGGGGGEDGLMGPPGPPGASATINIGTVTSVAPGDTPTVTNSGTPANVILNFEIPAGADGQDGGTTEGVTEDAAGWDIVDGVIKEIPPDFPPIGSMFVGTSDVTGLTLTISKDPLTAAATISIDGDLFYNALMLTIAGIQADLTALAGEAAWGGITGTLQDQTDLWGQLQIRPRWTYAAVAPAAPNMGDKWFNSGTSVESVWIAAGVNAWVPI